MALRTPCTFPVCCSSRPQETEGQARWLAQRDGHEMEASKKTNRWGSCDEVLHTWQDRQRFLFESLRFAAYDNLIHVGLTAWTQCGGATSRSLCSHSTTWSLPNEIIETSSAGTYPRLSVQIQSEKPSLSVAFRIMAAELVIRLQSFQFEPGPPYLSFMWLTQKASHTLD